jgi:hypothetical protein
MKATHETIRRDRLFYCFVDFGSSPDARAIVHVLPSAVVGEALMKSHRQWFTMPFDVLALPGRIVMDVLMAGLRSLGPVTPLGAAPRCWRSSPLSVSPRRP